MDEKKLLKKLSELNTSLGIILIAALFITLLMNKDELFRSSNVVKSYMIEELNKRENTDKYKFNDFEVTFKGLKQTTDTKAKRPLEILVEGTYSYIYLPTNKTYTIVWKERVDGTFIIKQLY